MSTSLSKYNSTRQLLNANDVFTGQIEDIGIYNFITVHIYSDVDSIDNGLKLYFSNDTTDVFNIVITHTYYASTNDKYTIPVNYKYFKLEYTNSSTNQGEFHINVMYEQVNNNYLNVEFNKSYIDTFNRLRISELRTLYEINQIGVKNYLKEDEYTSGTGSITYNINESMNNLTVTGIGRVIRQTRLYCHYQPGKSFLIYATGIINSDNNGSNTTSRIGYFDDNNGMFFEYSNNTMYVVLRSNTTGSPVDTKVSQQYWNVDNMNGNGPFRINIDFSKYLIYTINFSWLGAGVVEMGVYYAGVHYIVHRFRNDNIIVPYTVTPNLPGRFEIISTSNTDGSGSLKESCISINSETAQSLIGQTFSIGTTSARTVDDEEGYIMAIKLVDNKRQNVILKTASLICTTKGDVEYKIYLVLSPSSSPITDTGANNGFVNVNSNSIVQYNITGTAFNNTNAIVLYQGYFSTLVNIDTRQLSDKNDPIYLTAGIGINGFKSDYLVITGRNISGTNNESINCILNWIEI